MPKGTGKHIMPTGLFKILRGMKEFRGSSKRVALREQFHETMATLETIRGSITDRQMWRAEIFKRFAEKRAMRSMRFVRFTEAILQNQGCEDNGDIHYVVLPSFPKKIAGNRFCMLLGQPWNSFETEALLKMLNEGHAKSRKSTVYAHDIINLWNNVKLGNLRLSVRDIEDACKKVLCVKKVSITPSRNSMTIRGFQRFLNIMGHNLDIFPGVTRFRFQSCAVTNTQFVKHIARELKELDEYSNCREKVIRAEIVCEGPNEKKIIHSSFYDPRFSQIPHFIRAVTPIRWSDGMQVLELLRKIIASQHASLLQQGIPVDHNLRNVTMHAHCFYHMSKMLCPTGSLFDCLNSITRAEFAQKVNNGGMLYSTTLRKTLCRFTQGGQWASLLQWSNWIPFTHKELRCQSRKRQRRRDVFTREEIDRLISHLKSKQDHRCVAQLLSFLHTGARKRAIYLMKVCDVLDENNNIRTWVVLLEKFGNKRRVKIDPLLAEALQMYIHHAALSKDTYLFHNRIDHTRPCTSVRWFKDACTECGISGDHVHLHALRRTVLTWLYEAGNDVDVIRRWIGHVDAKTTHHYIEQTADQVYDAIVIPWLDSDLISCATTPKRPKTLTDIRKGFVSEFAFGGSTFVSSSASSVSTSSSDMHTQLTHMTFELYKAENEENAHIIENLLTDVQRNKLYQWRAERETAKTQMRLSEKGINLEELLTSDSDDDKEHMNKKNRFND